MYFINLHAEEKPIHNPSICLKNIKLVNTVKWYRVHIVTEMFQRQFSLILSKIAHSNDKMFSFGSFKMGISTLLRRINHITLLLLLLLYLGHGLTFIRNLRVHFWDGPLINAYIISFGATQQVLKGFPTPPLILYTPESVINSQVKETI